MKISTIILALFFVACAPVSRVYVSKVQDPNLLKQSSLVYNLPKTGLKISISAVEITFVPGPYHNYASKYLGIEGARHELASSWEISDAIIESVREPDPDYFYTVRTENGIKDCYEEIEMLAEKGLILTPAMLIKDGPLYSGFTFSKEMVHFKDLSIKRNLTEKSQTSYKRVFRDSAFVQVPVHTKQLKTKSIEQKAEEAANFIIKLRKRRFKLLTGQSETSIDGEAMKIAIRELNKTENEYLSLFLGKTYYDTIQKTVEYVPDINKKNDQVVLFRFSESEGFSDAQATKGKPIFFAIQSQSITKKLELPRPLKNAAGDENILFYRLPEEAVVSLTQDNKILLEGEISVFQYGIVVGQGIIK